MFGFVIGTLCLFGLMGMMGARHHHHREYAYGGGGCGGGRRGWHGGRFGGRGPGGHGPFGDFARGAGEEGFAKAAAEVFKRRLDIDEDQEGIVDHALKDLQAAVKELRSVVVDSRDELGKAFKGESVDDPLLATVFQRHDEAVAKARREVVSALKQIHAVLTPEQRERAASWLGAADGKWV